MQQFSIIISFIILSSFVDGQTQFQTASLLRGLLNRYPCRESLLVPFEHRNQLPVKINFTLEVMSFDGIDDVNERMSIAAIVYLDWYDPFLRTSETGLGQTYFNVPPTSIWTPLIAQTGNPDSMFRLMDYGANLKPWVDTTTGAVSWYPTGRFETRCSIDLAYFPFDEQTCDLTFVSWNDEVTFVQLWHLDEQVVIFSRSAATNTTELAVESSVWKLVDVTWSFGLGLGTSSRYSQVNFRFRCRRKPIFYVFAVLFPTGLLSVLQMAGLFHPHGPERPSFFLVLLLTFWVLQQGSTFHFHFPCFYYFCFCFQVTSTVIPKTSRRCAVIAMIAIQSCFAIVVTLESIIACRVLSWYHGAKRQREMAIRRRALQRSSTLVHSSNETSTTTLVSSQPHQRENSRETNTSTISSGIPMYQNIANIVNKPAATTTTTTTTSGSYTLAVPSNATNGTATTTGTGTSSGTRSKRRKESKTKVDEKPLSPLINWPRVIDVTDYMLLIASFIITLMPPIILYTA